MKYTFKLTNLSNNINILSFIIVYVLSIQNVFLWSIFTDFRHDVVLFSDEVMLPFLLHDSFVFLQIVTL